MKKRKLMMTIMSLALVLVVAVGGTLAYLSDQSNQVTNTFNVGSGYEEEENPDDPDNPHTGLWLDETAKPESGNPLEPSEDNRTETGVAYEEMMPGSVVAKDPTFHLTAGSTDSYVFAYVTGLDDIVSKDFLITDSKKETEPTLSVLNSSWIKVKGVEGKLDGLYVWGSLNEDDEVVGTILQGGRSTDQLFGYVWYKSSVNSTKHDQNYAEQQSDEDKILSRIEIKGVAVQTANLTVAQAQTEAEKVLDIGQPVEP